MNWLRRLPTLLLVCSLMVALQPASAFGQAVTEDHDHDMATHQEKATNPSPEPHRTLPTTVIHPEVPANARGRRVNPFAKSSSVIGASFDRMIHLFELPFSYRILSCSGSGNTVARNRAGLSTCEVYDRATGARRTLRFPTDLFCGSGVFDEYGNLIFSGGTANGGYSGDNAGKWMGSAASYLFNSRTLAVTRLGDMKQPSWYGNMVRIWFGDNSIYAFGGIHNGAQISTWERKRSGSRVWTTMPWRHTNHSYDDYKVLNASHVAYTGATATNSGQQPHILNLNTGKVTVTPGLRYVTSRNASQALMLYPAQAKNVAIFGGGSTRAGAKAINAVDIINYGVFPRSLPRYRAAAPMPAGVMFVLANNLPNGQVFVTGGTREWRAGSVRWAAIYTPWTNRWTRLAPARVGRNYHSTSMTDAYGRVVTYGGNPANGSFESRSEIFTPWYGYRPRPVILRAPNYMRSGGSYLIDVKFPRRTKLGRVTLDSPRSTTHSSSDTNYGLFSVPAKTVKRTGRVHRIRLTIPSASSVPHGAFKLSVVTGGKVTRRGPSGHVPSRLSKWVGITR